AVVHLEHFLVGAHDQLVVDADLAELVDDDGVFLAVRLGQDAVQQGGLAGTEIAGEHGDGELFGRNLFGRHNGTTSTQGPLYRRSRRPQKPSCATPCPRPDGWTRRPPELS